MRSWLANKLFDLARWVDWDAVQKRCEYAVLADRIALVVNGLAEVSGAPAKRGRGRPKGSKDKAPRKVSPNTYRGGRKPGSKNKPKVQA